MNSAPDPTKPITQSPMLAALEKMPPATRRLLTVAYFEQLFERDPIGALASYPVLAETRAMPDLYLKCALQDEEHAQAALTAVMANLTLPSSQQLFVEIAMAYPELEKRQLTAQMQEVSPPAQPVAPAVMVPQPETASSSVLNMLRHVRSGAHRDVPSIPDTRVLGVRRSAQRVSPPQPETKERKPG